jgi:hypothetical protein
MTNLEKPVTRRTPETTKGKRIVVTLTKDSLVLRLERCRYRYVLPIKTAWVYAAMLHAEAKRAERRARKASA